MVDIFRFPWCYLFILEGLVMLSCWCFSTHLVDTYRLGRWTLTWSQNLHNNQKRHRYYHNLRHLNITTQYLLFLMSHSEECANKSSVKRIKNKKDSFNSAEFSSFPPVANPLFSCPNYRLTLELPAMKTSNNRMLLIKK